MSAGLRRNWLEWLVFGFGLVLFVATVGYLAVQAANTASPGPALTVTFGEPRVGPMGYLVPVEIRNGSGEAAADMTLEAAIADDRCAGGPVTARITVGYVPGYGRLKAWLEFRRDPRLGRLVVRSLGYVVP